MKIKIKWVSLFLCLSLVTGCTSLRNNPPEKNYYRVQAQSGLAAANLPETGDGLRVQRFSIAPEFETSSFVYRLSPTRFTTDFYNNFMVSPARMITEIIQEDLWASPLFSPVPDQAMADGHFQLGGKILAFHGDIQNLKQPRAIVSIRLILEKNTGGSFTPILHKTYEAQIRLKKPDPGMLAAGLGKGISQILAAFYTDIEKTGLTEK